ncbi:VanZ family protein [Limosilactobacillus sp. STM2_1]|uniref:VanZ family protein n=1 Tax=Limosilactobacillus rudii TaxID=2759755 RepID=A0A7W3YLW3_9LACO|nr:VanZ family protein [Limosilactobacillus rudii]MBB1080044.1 VanZ family protein [Limosilactobacillus rudii]MBB1096468.1 VanZ family protein [Limosilactobacillus rudii]MCD7133531.1 VanZ family protein [Limosilactobacillus rudii]
MRALIHWIPFFIYFFAGTILITHNHLWERFSSKSQHFTITTLFIYLTAIDWLCLTPTMFNFNSANKLLFYFHGAPFNIIPLQGLSEEFFLNVIMTVPFGIYLYLINHQMPFTHAILYGFLFSFFIESNQFVCDLLFHIGRVADVDDLISNTLGTTIGFAVMIMLDQTVFHHIIKQFMLIGGKSDKLNN